jgi:hypothetical protein
MTRSLNRYRKCDDSIIGAPLQLASPDGAAQQRWTCKAGAEPILNTLLTRVNQLPVD